ncbi:unnamed protein product [Diatraea saccharalis]|uniref:Peptidase M14 domain-containing protein n=1 Tax=Diatraea saccharalis TaxID=40085 RepID=A0A9N9WCS8_9NEOP|nr:unnamed protein product [Diatraea saccharalis]
MLIKSILINIVVAIVSTQELRYDNYALYKVHPRNERDIEYLNKVEKENQGLDFWKTVRRVGDYASVVAPPELRHKFEHLMSKRSIRSDLMLTNIQDALEAQTYSRRKRDNNMLWTVYQTIEDIYAWFYDLASQHSFVSLIQLGTTYEGRNITGIKISRGSSGQNIILEGGQIGADWLSPTVLTYIVNQLIEGEDPDAIIAARDFDWHIFPILNPDGHKFSDDSVRLWTKNRRPTVGTNLGVDLTKNWNSQWGIIGASFDPASNNYAGNGPFTEIETRSLSRYIESLYPSVVAYLSFRGFGQRFLIPFAHSTAPMYNYVDMLTLGRRAMGALAGRYGTQYLVGTSAQVHDGNTGNVADWVKYRFNVTMVATYHLRDTGGFGYILPVNQILPSCEETFDSLMSLLREARHMNVI